jgi:RNA polymerase sigma factor (sigma-70 family)
MISAVVRSVSLPQSVPSSAVQSAPPCLVPDTHEDWFKENVQPHESGLRRWLHAKFPSLPDLEDLIQESYARLFRAYRAGKVQSPKNYLYTTAANAALDRFRHAKVRREDSLEVSGQAAVLQDRTDVAEAVSRNQELIVLREAISSLPPRCRQVFTLRKLYGMSHAQISRQLGISPKTIEAQINIGMQRCAAYLRSRGMP